MNKVTFPAVFALRLPRSTRREADEIAQREGLSLNQFITLAVAEKIVRLESRRVQSPLEPVIDHDPESGEKFPIS